MIAGKRMIGVAAVLGTLSIVLAVGHALAEQDRAKKKVRLPAAASAAIEKAFPGAQISKVGKEKEGVTLYEAKLTKDGVEMDVKLAADGTIVEVDKSVAAGELPGPAAAALAKVAGDAQVKELERAESHAVVRLVKLDKPAVVFEAKFLKNGKTIEVKIRSDGTVLAQEAKGDDENEDRHEEKVALDQAPPAVKQAILKEAGNNPVKEVKIETEDGQTVYKAEWVADGKGIELKLSVDGKIMDKQIGDDEHKDKGKGKGKDKDDEEDHDD